MTPQEFTALADFARRRAGLVFSQDRSYVLEGRLKPLLRRRALRSPSDLISSLRGDDALAGEVVDTLVNNETSFFRDGAPFQILETKVLPAFVARGLHGPVRIWSAACSTGQEPYSIAMLCDRVCRNGRLGFEILATDISETCLKLAREGRYSEFEAKRGLSAADHARYMEPDPKGWRVRQAIKDKIRWRAFNLLDDPGELGRFEIAFCRNVLIYFDQETRRRVLERLAGVIIPDGYLFMGAAETMLAFADIFTPMPDAPGVYRPSPSFRRPVG
jgi:chemotaxis protein methyltransferase CheR